jgi:hypothetical protein
MQKLKIVFFIYMICMVHCSCIRTRYINCGTNYLVNYPRWELFFNNPALKALMLRVDTVRKVGNLDRNLGNQTVNFEFYQLCVAMNIEGGCRGGVSPSAEKLRTYRISYQPEDVKINLFVSDSLNDTIIKTLKTESLDKN